MKIHFCAAAAAVALMTGAAHAGSLNAAYLTQVGSGNSASQDQYDSGANVNTTQNGAGNTATDTQRGGSPMGALSITQDAEGGGNQMTSSQTNNLNSNTQVAFGSNNKQTNTQVNSLVDTSRENVSFQRVNGTDNRQDVTQTGSANLAGQNIGQDALVLGSPTTNDNGQNIAQVGDHNTALQYVGATNGANYQTITQNGNSNQAAQGIGYVIADGTLIGTPPPSGTPGLNNLNYQSITQGGGNNNVAIQYVIAGANNIQTVAQTGSGNTAHQIVH